MQRQRRSTSNYTKKIRNVCKVS